MRDIITITENAAARIKNVLATQSTAPEAVLVSVTTKGCSGMKYDVQFLPKLADKPKFADEIHQHGVTVVIDPKAALFITGSTMDYVETLERSGFDFINPNEAGRCGCGESFMVAKDSVQSN